MKFSKKKSFTLIEIMVTIIILGALVSFAVPNYLQSKRNTEYKGAVGQVRSIAGVAKDYFLTQGSYPSTSSTANTNSVLGLKISDGYFNNYSVNSGVSPNVQVTGGSCVYTFNTDGVRISTSGSGCIP
ncbi:MAG: prepilin-type N-terminal cleavage/methylation domain-containing protein [Candidatus Omnitrophica bacterium]|nr:prepilin-type N-terminal cleavage/methylation domain-containing protein [Candidatus Omnitrophota bacterium]